MLDFDTGSILQGLGLLGGAYWFVATQQKKSTVRDEQNDKKFEMLQQGVTDIKATVSEIKEDTAEIPLHSLRLNQLERDKDDLRRLADSVNEVKIKLEQKENKK